MELITVDPKVLVVDHNVRSKIGDIASLTASIKERGVLFPILVAEEDGKYHVIAGSRRTAAALKAKVATVPCIVTDNGDARGVLEKQLIENLQRVDLSAADEAKGFEQLAAFGMTYAEIVAVSGRDLDHVTTALVVAKSATASTIAAKHDLTLEQAAVIAEFDDDKTAVKELTVAAVQTPNEFDHKVVRMRAERGRLAEIERLRAELTEAGVTIVTDTPTYDLTRPPTRITELSNGKRDFTAASHKKCPGHAAYIVDHQFNKPTVIEVCTDPKGNGHRTKFAGSADDDKTSEQKDQESNDRREMLAGNKEWRLAQPVRIEFIISFLQRKTVPKGVLRFVAEEIMGDPDSLGGRMGTTNESLVYAFLGATSSKTSYRSGRVVGLGHVRREKSDARLPMILLAQIAATREQMMDQTTWRLGSAASARWLTFLGQQGYGLSDIEKKAAARK